MQTIRPAFANFSRRKFAFNFFAQKSARGWRASLEHKAVCNISGSLETRESKVRARGDAHAIGASSLLHNFGRRRDYKQLAAVYTRAFREATLLHAHIFVTVAVFGHTHATTAAAAACFFCSTCFSGRRIKVGGAVDECGGTFLDSRCSRAPSGRRRPPNKICGRNAPFNARRSSTSTRRQARKASSQSAGTHARREVDERCVWSVACNRVVLQNRQTRAKRERPAARMCSSRATARRQLVIVALVRRKFNQRAQ